MENNAAPKAALPLLVLLAIASALGVGVAIALAGVAMLLAAPAYAGEAGEGRLLLERSRIVQAYHNPYEEPLAGVYVYRLPRGALIDALTFRLGVGETLVIELEYRSPRRILARYCSPFSAAPA